MIETKEDYEKAHAEWTSKLVAEGCTPVQADAFISGAMCAAVTSTEETDAVIDTAVRIYAETERALRLERMRKRFPAYEA